jgi:hypothetical protein
MHDNKRISAIMVTIDMLFKLLKVKATSVLYCHSCYSGVAMFNMPSGELGFYNEVIIN